MSEEEKLEQIEKVKREWAEEVLRLEQIELGQHTLNNSANVERFKLEEKYMKKIMEIEAS